MANSYNLNIFAMSIRPTKIRPVTLASLTILTLSVLSLTSCLTNSITMSYDTLHPAVWNEEQSEVLFLARSSTFRHRKTYLVSNPKGARGRTIMEDFGLYHLDISSNEVNRVELLEEVEGFRFRGILWDFQALFKDSLIYYRVNPRSGWDHLLTRARSRRDTLFMQGIIEKYGGIRVIDSDLNNLGLSGHTDFSEIYHGDSIPDNTVPAPLMRDLRNNIPLESLGLVVMEVFPRDPDQYISGVIFGRIRCSVVRRAVFEQLIKPMEPEEIQFLIEKMDEYRESLEEPNKAFYTRFSESLYDSLQALIR